MYEVLLIASISAIALWYTVWHLLKRWPPISVDEIDYSIPIIQIDANSDTGHEMECRFGADIGWKLVKKDEIVRRLIRHQQPIPQLLSEWVPGGHRINWGGEHIFIFGK